MFSYINKLNLLIYLESALMAQATSMLVWQLLQVQSQRVVA